MTNYILTANERDVIQADLNRLKALRDNTHKALKGASLKHEQRESCRKALPVLDGKIKMLNEKLIADRLLRDCDECNIPKHYQDRSR
jgi:hypothetical protein